MIGDQYIIYLYWTVGDQSVESKYANQGCVISVIYCTRLMKAYTDVSAVPLKSDQRDDNYIPHSSDYQILSEIGQELRSGAEVKTTISVGMLV